MTTHKVFPEGLLGKKLGMTQVFTDDGQCVPVTVIEAGPCFVLGLREELKGGYSAVQLGFGPKKAQRCNKSEIGNFASAAKGSFYHVKEMRCDVKALGWGEVGKELKVADVFTPGEHVDVTGTSIGRGFQGVIRRHGMKGQPASRGTHETERNVGSIGCRKTPGRVIKGKRMPGHMGNVRVTVQNLKVIAVRPEDNVIMVRGAIPGPAGAYVTICKAVKKLQSKKQAA